MDAHVYIQTKLVRFQMADKQWQAREQRLAAQATRQAEGPGKPHVMRVRPDRWLLQLATSIWSRRTAGELTRP